ncbi:hypothetical protein CWI39_3744p0010 [Hamiltosporidium magnivora]|uniref:Uncharacterized protein n=2 Tax=Hamiltosporidium TaxID=1176354 RepID=A0A4Q9KPS8_9MICR|nr:hypothetical protein CWI39_3744p0010 [Hamiltosporidium magnivora]
MNYFKCYLPFTLLIGFIYLKRYLIRVKKRNDFYFFVKLYLVCCLIGNKYWEDSCGGNCNECSVWGFEVEDINMLEKHVLNTLGYDLEISSEEIESVIYYERICEGGSI